MRPPHEHLARHQTLIDYFAILIAIVHLVRTPRVSSTIEIQSYVDEDLETRHGKDGAWAVLDDASRRNAHGYPSARWTSPVGRSLKSPISPAPAGRLRMTGPHCHRRESLLNLLLTNTPGLLIKFC